MGRRKNQSASNVDVIFVFRKPTWHWGLPLFLLVFVWGSVGIITFLPKLASHSKFLLVAETTLSRLIPAALSLRDFVAWAGVVSLPLLVFMYRGLARITMTKDALIYQTLLGDPKVLRWVDIDEVDIRRIHHRLEGQAGERRVLILYGKRPRFGFRRPKIVISNTQLEGYRKAEQTAVQIAVPAIAEKLRAQLRRDGTCSEFGRPSLGADLRSAIWFGLAGAGLVLAGQAMIEGAVNRVAVWALVALGSLLQAIKTFRGRWYAIDQSSFYVIRRGLRRLRIPLLSIREAYVKDGIMTIIASPPSGSKGKEIVIRDRQFFRNRGVMLTLLRLLIRDEIERQRHMANLSPLRRDAIQREGDESAGKREDESVEESRASTMPQMPPAFQVGEELDP